MNEILTAEKPMSEAARELLRRARAGLWPVPHPPSPAPKDDKEEPQDAS